MEPSPLTQDSRPEIFQPKIIRLYETLFRVREAPTDSKQSADNYSRKMMKKSSFPRASGKSSSCIALIRVASSA